MKKKIIILVFFAFFGLLKANAFTVARISGTVTNIQTGLPIAWRIVTITDSISFTQNYLTNSNGYYNDSIFNSTSTSVKYYIITYDCNSVMHYDTVTTTGYVWKIANFSVCNIGKDVGVLKIVLPGDTTYLTGSTFHPLVKIKNYSMYFVYGIHVAYSINGQSPIIETITDTIFANDTITYTFSTGCVLPNTNFNFCAYTINNDINPNNDTLCKTVITSSPLFDAGVTLIVFPGDSASAGDTIFPKITIKNYGSQTITNLQIGYKVNGQLISFVNFNNSLPQNNSVNYTFSQYFICPSNTFSFCSFTQLSGDFNSINDTAYKTIISCPALRDVGIIDIIVPDLIVCSGSVVYPKVVIKNFGTMPLTSIPVNYQRGTMPVVTETWTSTNPLAYGDTAIYTFTAAFTFPMGSTYEFSSFTSLANDANMLNNKLYEIKLISDQPFLSNVTGDDTVIIGQSNVIYQANGFSGPNAQFIWTLPPGAISDSAYNNIIIVHYGSNAQNGNISCKIMNACGTSQTIVFPVSVFLTPPPPIIYQNGNTLYSGYSTGNQWYFENSAIPGANQPTYTSTQTGHYFCKVTINGLTSYESNTIYVAFTGIEDAFIKSHFEVFPNPTNDKTNFKYALNTTSDVCLKITDIEGRLIQTLVNISQDKGDYLINFDASMLKKGIYFYQFRAGNSILNGKLIIVN